MENICGETKQSWKETQYIGVSLQDSVPYFLSHDQHASFIKELKKEEFDKIFIITSHIIANLYAMPYLSLFAQYNINFNIHIIDDCEHNKSFANLEKICEYLIDNDVTKDSLLIALGGGVIGNIVGLVAALIYRGIRYVEIPTTMMAQTDSTLSNKQGINGKRGKNQFGVYYAPMFIWSDTKYLSSESIGYRRSGIVEAIKNGLISDASFVEYLKQQLTPKLEFSDERMHALTRRIIASKEVILRLDPGEKNYAIILEYGHTFGHALEWLSGGELSHGEAVAIGMCIAAELSHHLEVLSKEDLKIHYEMLEQYLGVSIGVPPYISTNMIMDTIKSDNKKKRAGVKYVLLERIGKVYNPEGDFMVSVDEQIVRSVLDRYIEQHSKTENVVLLNIVNQ